MCLPIGSCRNSDRSPSPPPRPARRSRHSQEVSDPASPSTRRRRRPRDPDVIRHHARHSTRLVFEGDSSSAQTPRHDEPRAKSRSKRHRPKRHTRTWAAGIPEDVEDEEDPGSPAAISTSTQGKQPVLREGDSLAEGKTKKPEAGKPLKEKSFETRKPTEKDKAESSKTKADTKNKRASKLSIDISSSSESSAEAILENSKTASQTEAQKAVTAKTLPTSVNEMNLPPVPDPPIAIASISVPPEYETKKVIPDKAEHIDPSSVVGFGGSNKEKGIQSQSKKDDSADAISVSSIQKVKGIFKKKK